MNPKYTEKAVSNQYTDIRIGDIFIMRFSGEGSEQGGVRPGVVFQNNVGNEHSPNIIALPITSNLKKLGQPTHVELLGQEGLKKDSMILCENPQRMSKKRLGRRISRLDDQKIKEMAVGSMLASSALGYLDYDELIDVWQKAQSLNGIPG